SKHDIRYLGRIGHPLVRYEDNGGASCRRKSRASYRIPLIATNVEKNKEIFAPHISQLIGTPNRIRLYQVDARTHLAQVKLQMSGRHIGEVTAEQIDISALVAQSLHEALQYVAIAHGQGIVDGGRQAVPQRRQP